MAAAAMESTVKEWLVMLEIACDPESPFAGMVDLSGIFELPIDVQREIHSRLEPRQLELIKKFYGPKEQTDAVPGQ
jgi:hypothetical protein